MSQGNNNNEGFSALLIGVILLAMLWGVWYLFQEPLLSALRWVRVGELWLIGLITDDYEQVRQWLMVAIPDRNLPADYPYKLTLDSLMTISGIVGQYLRWPAIAILAGCMIWALFFSLTMRFRTRYTLESLIKVQSITWPVITPIVDFDPAKVSARNVGAPVPEKLPIFAEALSPEEWIAFNRIPVVNHMPDKDAVRRAFMQQLGRRWQGLEGLPDYQRCLLAAMALRGVQKRKSSDDYLGQLATCWNHATGFTMKPEVLAEADKLLKDPKVGGKALEQAAHSAFRTTAFLAVLFWARENGGVLAPPSFLWLRAVDRNLWYALNNLGRRTFFPEGAGAMAHYMAEKAAKMPLPVPRVETAVITLSQHIARMRPKIPALVSETKSAEAVKV